MQVHHRFCDPQRDLHAVLPRQRRRRHAPFRSAGQPVVQRAAGAQLQHQAAARPVCGEGEHPAQVRVRDGGAQLHLRLEQLRFRLPAATAARSVRSARGLPQALDRHLCTEELALEDHAAAALAQLVALGEAMRRRLQLGKRQAHHTGGGA